MVPMRSFRYTLIIRGFVLCTVLAMVAVIVAFGVVPDGTQRAQAGLPTPTPIPTPAQASASIEASACDTTTGNPSKCLVYAGLPFTISLNLDSIDGLPDPKGDTVAGYGAIEYELTFGSTSVLEVKGEQWVWPDCDATAPTNTPPVYTTACIRFSSEESLYTGVMVELEMNCIEGADAQETVTITSLGLADSNGHVLPIKLPSAELTINCEDSVGGIAELPDVARRPLEAAGSSGPSMGLLAGLGVAAITGALALGGAAWYARRRWSR